MRGKSFTHSSISSMPSKKCGRTRSARRGRPFDSTVNGARMIASGVFDRHPKLQVLIVDMGGRFASILGRLEFNWHLNYNGIKNPPAGKPYTNKRSPSDYFKTNILVDCMGFSAIGMRAAVEMCGVDRGVRLRLRSGALRH
jgi:hypothetical protein